MAVRMLQNKAFSLPACSRPLAAAGMRHLKTLAGSEQVRHKSTQVDTSMQDLPLGRIPFPGKAMFDQPSVVPDSANERVLELMRTGRIFRYTLSAEESDVSQAEVAVAKWVGHDYAIGVNSCSSAINLAMLVAGVERGDKVITNAFTFTAIPSTIHNVGATPVFVESTPGFTMDIDHLREVVAENPDAKVLLLSHFRGKLSDVDAIVEICDERGITLIEDCAHGMGCTYKGLPAGRLGKLSVFSVQSDKVVNAGEGGFVTTNDPGWAADLVYLSGAYEKRYTHHVAAPVHDTKLMERSMTHRHNCSYRMHNVAGAMVLAQMPVLLDRVKRWNDNGEVLMAALAPAIDAGLIVVPPDVEGAEGCFDHCVFTTPTFDQEQRDMLGSICASRGVALKPFGTSFNARFFKNWNFLPEGTRPPMERTEHIVRTSWDMKMPWCFEPEDWTHVGAIMVDALFEVDASKNA